MSYGRTFESAPSMDNGQKAIAIFFFVLFILFMSFVTIVLFGG